MIIPLLAFLEACPGIGLLVSGVILLTVSTLLYTEQLVSLAQIIPLAFIGACLSDHMGFYLSRWFGPKIHHTEFAQKRATEFQRTEAFILKHGALAIVIGRLIPAVRSLVPMMVGVTGTRSLGFSLSDILACTLWSTGLGVLVIGFDNLLS